MTATSKIRGNKVEWDDLNMQWIGSDEYAPCGYCGLSPTPEGYDACLGKLENVSHACCGHGCQEDIYIIYKDKI